MIPRIFLGVSLLCGLAGCASTSTSEPAAQFSAQTYCAAGEFAETQHNYSNAIAQYRLAMTAAGPHTPAIYHLALIYTELKDYPHAIETWQQYVNATYGAALAYGDLAYAYQLAGKIPEATQAYQAALKKEPANSTCRVNYGRLLAAEGDITGAESQLHGILPEAQVHYQIGLACEAQKNLHEARAQFAKAAELSPQLLDAKARLTDLDSSSGG